MMLIAAHGAYFAQCLPDIAVSIDDGAGLLNFVRGLDANNN